MCQRQNCLHCCQNVQTKKIKISLSHPFGQIPPRQSLEGGVWVPGRGSSPEWLFQRVYEKEGQGALDLYQKKSPRIPSLPRGSCWASFSLSPRKEEAAACDSALVGSGPPRSREPTVGRLPRGARSLRPALPRPALWLAKRDRSRSGTFGYSTKLGGRRARITAVRAGARAAGSARRPKRAARTPCCAGPRNHTWPWLVAGAVTLHPTSGSAHLSARDASTFSFLGFGSSAAAIFTLPPNLGSSARPAPSTLGPTRCPHHCLLFP